MVAEQSLNKFQIQNDQFSLRGFVMVTMQKKNLHHSVPEVVSFNEAKSFKPIRILVVEDNQIVRLALHEMLTKLGCLADFASDGKTALALYQPYYDLILLDIGLPDFDGIIVAQTIRSIEQGKKVPIVAITSFHGDLSFRQQCESAGMDGYSPKPNQWQLQALIEQYTQIT